MTDLSPAAQAVMNAANSANSYGPDDCLNESRWIAAAALRAAAEQAAPFSTNLRQNQIHQRLVAIAAELEEVND